MDDSKSPSMGSIDPAPLPVQEQSAMSMWSAAPLPVQFTTMAITPEQWLALERLTESPPPPPSLYLDIPRSSYGCSTGDPVLPYITRILMEEDIDDRFFYLYPNHPALLQAQQPFAQILDESKNLQSGKEGGMERMSSDALCGVFVGAACYWPTRASRVGSWMVLRWTIKAIRVSSTPPMKTCLTWHS